VNGGVDGYWTEGFTICELAVLGSTKTIRAASTQNIHTRPNL